MKRTSRTQVTLRSFYQFPSLSLWPGHTLDWFGSAWPVCPPKGGTKPPNVRSPPPPPPPVDHRGLRRLMGSIWM